MGKDYKIICFVKNEIQNGDLEGLFHVFGDKFHVETCPFIQEFIYYEEKSEKKIRFGANVQNKYLLISKEEKPKLQGNIENKDVWDILLVSQECRLPEGFTFSKEMLVIYHGTFNNNKEYVENNIKSNVKKIKSGHHEPREEDGYLHLKGIADAWDTTTQKFDFNKYTQAKEKLIKWFGLNEKLNKALDFLHQSLGGTPADISILANGEEKFDLQVKFKKDNIEKTLQGWIDELKGKKGAEYNQALVNVRDALLEQAGVTGEN